MPYIKYINYKPKPATMEVIQHADRLLRQYAADGFEATLRMLYYRFITLDLFPDSWKNAAGIKNTIQSYGKLKSIMTNARDGGFIDWNHLADRNRSSEARPNWQDPKDFMESVAPQFNLDVWADQPKRLEVWVEKDALTSVIKRACEPFYVPFTACKGFMSASTIWESARHRILHHWNESKQPTIILHLGDHDPSGVDMTRDIRDRLKLYSTQTDDELLEQNGPVNLTIQRIALTMEQIRSLDLAPNPAKETDIRFAGYQAIYGDESWELDALEPHYIVDLITEHIRSHLAPRKFASSQRDEAAYRNTLVWVGDHWDQVDLMRQSENDDTE